MCLCFRGMHTGIFRSDRTSSLQPTIKWCRKTLMGGCVCVCVLYGEKGKKGGDGADAVNC